MIPKKYGIKFIDDAGDGIGGKVYLIDLQAAFHFSTKKQCYMTQAYYHTVGRPIPFQVPRPELELNESKKVPAEGDVGLAPFARSIGPDQKWDQKRWQALVDAFPGRKFLLYGVSRKSDGSGDDPKFVVGSNVEPSFDHDLEQLCLSIRDLRYGLVSVSTGPSHVAFATSTPCVLLINQGLFAFNPDSYANGLAIKETVWSIPVEKVVEKVRSLEARF